MQAPDRLGTCWRSLQQALVDAGLEPAPREGRAMVAQVTGIAENQLLLHEQDLLSESQRQQAGALLTRRLQGTPLAYVLGGTWFYGRWWPVVPGMLIPRPDTELLVEAALARLPQGGTVVEVGIGSGAIIGTILLERPDVQGIGTDIDPALVLRAGQVLGAHAMLAERLILRCGDMLAPVADKVDMIVSNPPYVTEQEWHALEAGVKDFEPKLALTGVFAGGNVDGLGFYRDFVPQAAEKLHENGWLMMEIGWQQRQGVTELLDEKQWTGITCIRDLAGRDRVIAAQLRPASR